MIRKAVEGDEAEITAINSQALTEPWSLSSISEELCHDSFVGFVHRNDQGSLDGYLLAREHCDGADLLMVAVLPSAQGRGTGRELVQTLIHHVKEDSKEKDVFLEVSRGNHRAINLYENMGFKTYLIRRSYYKDGSDALCMKLGLANP